MSYLTRLKAVKQQEARLPEGRFRLLSDAQKRIARVYVTGSLGRLAPSEAARLELLDRELELSFARDSDPEFRATLSRWEVERKHLLGAASS